MMTPKLKWLAAGAAVVAVAGTAALAGTLHHLTVNLPGGGTETIEYSGDVAPKVTFLTPEMVRAREEQRVWSPFAQMDRVSALMDAMAADMDRQMQVSMLRARQMQQQMLTPGMTNADLQALPAGTQSYSVTTISTANGVCTRSVRVTGAGQGMKPQMVSQSSGCGDDAVPSADAPKSTAIKALIDANPGPRRRI
jgi:hypothetical protein